MRNTRTPRNIGKRDLEGRMRGQGFVFFWGIPQSGGCEVVARADAACCCEFCVIKRHKQSFWVFLSENPRFKETFKGNLMPERRFKDKRRNP